jgi:hypothetical protein
MKSSHPGNLASQARISQGKVSEALLVCCLSGLAALTIGLPAQRVTPKSGLTTRTTISQPVKPVAIDSRLKLLGYGLFLVQIGLIPLKVRQSSPDLAEILAAATVETEVAIEH